MSFSTNQKSQSGVVIVSFLHCQDGDDSIQFFTLSYDGRMELKHQLNQYKKDGNALSLQRGKHMQLIKEYNPELHAWVLNGGDIHIPFEEGDVINIILPQAGG